MMRFFYASLLLVVFFPFYGQNSVRLVCSDGSLFRVYKNERAINKIPQSDVLLEKINEDTLYLKVEFEGTASKYGLTVYLLEKGLPVSDREFDYRISPLKNKVAMSFLDAYAIVPLPDPLVPENRQPVDTSYKLPLHFVETQNGKAVYYNNLPKTGSCTTAMPDAFLKYTSVLMKNKYAGDHNYAVAENISRNNCLNIEQLNALLGYINGDIDRLRLVKLAFYNVVDPQNQRELEKSFQLDVMKAELNGFLNHAGDYKIRSANSCIKPSPEEDIQKLVANLSALLGDAQRMEFLKKIYGDYCFSVSQVLLVLEKFVHDREKTEAAKLLYFNCTEKESYGKVTDVFSFPQYTKELQDFLDKQKK